MQKLFMLLVGAICWVSAYSQNDQGTIVFNRKIDYVKIMDALPYLSQEEKDRIKLTWGKSEGRGSNYNLTFEPNKSVYTYGIDDREYNWSWRKDEFLIIKEDADKIKRQFVLGGKLYLQDGTQDRIKWKMKNEIREIAGYLCMKATTIDTIKNQTIDAWFTDQIPVSSGPEGFGGLPGMILMLDINDGTSIVEATKVDMAVPEHPIPKKIKGKKIDTEEYASILTKFFKNSIEGERNPFWEVRY